MVIVHCFRCDDAVEASTDADGPLWCATCAEPVMGPPSDTGDRSVRWSASGLLLAGQSDEAPDDYRFYRRRSRGGSILAAGMLGLQRAMFGPIDDESPVVVIDDEPEGDDDITLHLDENERADSWIRFRHR